MKELVRSPGTGSGSVLRIGQCPFAAASIRIMVLWSFGLARLDLYALRRKTFRTLS